MGKSKQIPFLETVAEDLIKRFGNNLAEVTVVFPSRRARLFFNNSLYNCTQSPIWAPRYYSIEDLFYQVSDLQLADELLLISELYKSYIDIYNSEAKNLSNETLDEFFFFGEILLSDFEDIDKNLINARSLFDNLRDLDHLKDNFSHLSELQIEALSRFLTHTFEGDTLLKSNFWSIWNILGEVYTLFKKRLREKEIAYQGMLMRSVVEDENISFDADYYVFIGFNVLSKCEEKLFKLLQNKSLFYWDIDKYYSENDNISPIEAGKFILDNIRKFGSALDIDEFDNFLNPSKQISIIASPSESAQTAYISTWIKSLEQTGGFSDPDTAIILCNENILPTVMHAIPFDDVDNVNITMGFPVMQSPICSFLQVLIEMQLKGYVESGKSFRYKYVLPVLRHPYMISLFPESKEIEKKLIKENIFFSTLNELKNKTIFTYAPTTIKLIEYLLNIIKQIGIKYKDQTEFTDIYAGLYQESVFRVYQVINRLYGLLISGDIVIQKGMFLRLLKKIFSKTIVPFHGEPLKGLQIMGVLETRTLDFKNILLMSVNEGFMPGINNDNTFIPQFIRKHFGLSTVEHQDSIYAYYFYRLLQRAEKITLIYNTESAQTGKAEMSRYLLQLLMDRRLDIKRFNLHASVKPLQKRIIEIEKNKNIIRQLKELYDRNTNPNAIVLSPSALNVFIDCSFKFYLQYIEKIKAEEDLSDDLDSSVFGTIFHRAAEILYRKIGRVEKESLFSPFLVNKEHLNLFLKNERWIDAIVEQAFSEEYFKGRKIDSKMYNGEQLINFRVIRHMLKRLVAFDKQHAPFYIIGLERKVFADFKIKDWGLVKIGGVIDRIQEKNETLSIIDYKSGGSSKTYKTLEDLVFPKDNRASHIFQIYIYSTILIKNGETKKIVPELIYLQDAGKEDYSSAIFHEKEILDDFNIIAGKFEEIFAWKISELFDENIPFRQTEIQSKCNYCDFRELCNR